LIKKKSDLFINSWLTAVWLTNIFACLRSFSKKSNPALKLSGLFVFIRTVFSVSFRLDLFQPLNPPEIKTAPVIFKI